MSASQLLARAFQYDPFIAWADANSERRLRTMNKIFAGMLNFARRGGGHLYEEGVGSVHWHDAQSSHMEILDYLTTGTWKAVTVAPPAVLVRMGAHEGEAMARVARHFRSRSAYVGALGVEPSVTGKGHGGRLLEQALRQMRGRWDFCVLRTEQPKNVPFYLAHGFREVEQFVVEKSGLSSWVFIREV